ncbi:hypothetical protein [Streptomyces erythrochromogenes]|uniref:hypothetical protein n=1 Tax=Streptomyces erythrochromogenes TaxID=285574 RepID=UPI0037D6E5D7
MSLTDEDIALLEHVHDVAGGDPNERVDLQSAPLGSRPLQAAKRRLLGAGLIELASISDDVKITQFGLDAVTELRIRRSNGPARTAALRLYLIRWLYDSYLNDGRLTSTSEFLTSDRCRFAGQAFSEREVSRTVGYLDAAGLIDGVRIDQTDHLLRPCLTSKGVDCAESEKSVSEFLNPTPPASTTFNVRINGSQNVAVGTQSNFSQTNGSNIDPAALAQLAHFANVAREGLASYGMDADQQVEVSQIADDLEAEATSDTPDRGRLRRLNDRLVEALSPAAGSALGGIVVALGQQAAVAIGS